MKRKQNTRHVRTKIMIKSALPYLVIPIDVSLERLGWQKISELRTSKSTYIEYSVPVRL